MPEGFDSYATPVAPQEKNPLTDEEMVQSALDHSLTGDAKDIFAALNAVTDTQEDFAEKMSAFNKRPAEERGLGRYDHGRPLVQNIDRQLDARTPKGYRYIVTLKKDGTIELS